MLLRSSAAVRPPSRDLDAQLLLPALEQCLGLCPPRPYRLLPPPAVHGAMAEVWTTGPRVDTHGEVAL